MKSNFYNKEHFWGFGSILETSLYVFGISKIITKVLEAFPPYFEHRLAENGSLPLCENPWMIRHLIFHMLKYNTDSSIFK